MAACSLARNAFGLPSSKGADLFGLVVAANEIRRRLAGDVISYVVTRNINFTNVCFVGCKFCAFSVSPRDETAYFLTPEEVGEKSRQAASWGATEVCIQGGLPRNLPPFYYRDVLRAVKSATPKMHAHAFSPMEMVYGTELTGMPVREYLLMLKDNGLDTLPGTAAEILDDTVRLVLSRNKLTTAQWCEVIETAHECGIRSTSTMMYGHRESTDHWVNQLLLLRSIQSRTGGITEFVPLGFIHDNTLLFEQGLARSGGTLEEHLKVHALARIMLAGSINHIQVSWVKLGREVSQLCMLAGADDYGGTLFEENISRLAGATAGQYVSVDEFQERIRELGRVPAQRNTTYTHYFNNDARRCNRARCRRECRVIAIVGGTGPEGSGLALRWARAGEQIVIGSRDATRAQAAATQIAEKVGALGSVEGLENSQAVKMCDCVVLTVPFAGQADLLKQLKPSFRPGTVLIDATVPLAAAVGGRPTRLLGVWQGSAAEQAAELVGKNVSVAAAFHSLSATVLNGDQDVDCDVIVCSDDDNGRQVASELAVKIPGVRAIDGGKLENARIVESMTALLITLNIRHKVHGAGWRVTGLGI